MTWQVVNGSIPAAVERWLCEGPLKMRVEGREWWSWTDRVAMRGYTLVWEQAHHDGSIGGEYVTEQTRDVPWSTDRDAAAPTLQEAIEAVANGE